MAIRVLIVDDISSVRENLRILLELAGDIDVVGEAENGAEAVLQAEILRPEVVLMDLEMPVMDGFEATRLIKVKQPACRVIILTIHGGRAEQISVSTAGADLFLEKGGSMSLLFEAIYGRTGCNDRHLKD